MKQILAILFFFTASFSCHKQGIDYMQEQDNKKNYSYLALGDSYTIGQSVPPSENFPNQVAAMLNNDSILFQPRIIAKTGWTTDELETGIVNANSSDPLRSSYDFVSLLIGVNNQYRGRTVENYKPEFEALLVKAIHYAGNRPERVVVFSIPDWGVTPFAQGRDRAQIAMEIDAYNAANKDIALRYHIYYIDITAWTREAASDTSLITSDGLHPSGKEYYRWAQEISSWIRTKI